MSDVTSLPPGIVIGHKPAASPAVNETRAERLARVRKAKADRDAQAEVEREDAEIARLELEERLTKELGPAGREHVIVDCYEVGEGCIAFRLGEDVLFTTYKESKMTVMDIDAFTTACLVHPSRDEYRKIVGRRPFVADRCALALSTLNGVKIETNRGK